MQDRCQDTVVNNRQNSSKIEINGAQAFIILSNSGLSSRAENISQYAFDECISKQPESSGHERTS